MLELQQLGAWVRAATLLSIPSRSAADRRKRGAGRRSSGAAPCVSAASCCGAPGVAAGSADPCGKRRFRAAGPPKCSRAWWNRARPARSVFQASFGGDDAIEDGFAVLRFADLQVRCFGRRGNVIAGRIDEINLVCLAADLTAEDEGGLGAGAALLQGLGTFLLHAITNGADIVRGIEYVFDCVEAELGGRILEVALDGVDHRLRGRETAGGEQDEEAFAWGAEHVHFAVGADVIHARVSA